MIYDAPGSVRFGSIADAALPYEASCRLAHLDAPNRRSLSAQQFEPITFGDDILNRAPSYTTAPEASLYALVWLVNPFNTRHGSERGQQSLAVNLSNQLPGPGNCLIYSIILLTELIPHYILKKTVGPIAGFA